MVLKQKVWHSEMKGKNCFLRRTVLYYTIMRIVAKRQEEKDTKGGTIYDEKVQNYRYENGKIRRFD